MVRNGTRGQTLDRSPTARPASPTVSERRAGSCSSDQLDHRRCDRRGNEVKKPTVTIDVDVNIEKERT